MARTAAADPFSLHPQGYRVTLEWLVGLGRLAVLPERPPHRQTGAAQAGRWRTRRRGRGIEFAEVRRYQPGDDVRAIDWRVTARRGAVHTRLYEEEQERPLLLLVDLRPPMFFGSRCCFKSVQAATVAALMAWHGLRRGDRVGGRILGSRDAAHVRPLRRRRNVLALLEEIRRGCDRLTSPTEPAATTLAEELKLLEATLATGSELVIISDFHDFDRRSADALAGLARHHPLTLVAISDPLEQRLPADPDLRIGDERRSIRLGDIVLPELPLRQRHAELRDCCRSLALPLLELSTADPPLARLVSFHHLREGRRG